ncbi:hypothetical protein [Roseovarius marisflavi]
MGLAIVKKHVQLAGGRIEVILGAGRGAEFRIFWPCVIQNNSQKGQAA